MKIIKERLPIYYASYLVNGDGSGLEKGDEPLIEKTLRFLEEWHESKLWCIDMKEDIHFEQSPSYMPWLPVGDYATYIFHTEGLNNG